MVDWMVALRVVKWVEKLVYSMALQQLVEQLGSLPAVVKLARP